jgi:acyl dehydratase
MLYFEDMVVGTKAAFGVYAVTREEVVEFASRFDPQPFHLNDEAAAQTFFGRMSASGMHTCAMTMKMMVDHWQQGNPVASLGSPGVDNLRWIKPVYPGDILRLETELVEKRQSQSKPEMGFIKSRVSVFNQKDDVVMTMVTNGIIRVKSP